MKMKEGTEEARVKSEGNKHRLQNADVYVFFSVGFRIAIEQSTVNLPTI